MKILYLARMNLADPSGLAMRARLVADALRDLGDVEVIDAPVMDGDVIRYRRHRDGVEAAAARRTPRVGDWLRWAAGGPSTRIDLRNDYAAERAALATLVDHGFDLAVCFRYRAAIVLPPGRARHVITDVCDWEGDAFPEAARARWRSSRTPRHLWDLVAAERDAWNLRRSVDRADECTDLWLAASDADRDGLGYPHARTLPNAYAEPPEPLERVGGDPVILLAASYDYFPNLEGARWFVAEVLPLVRAAVPSARLRLVGRGTEQLDLPAVAGVDVVGQVPDMAAELARATVVIAPNRRATATRLKIMEAWANRVPVVATTAGAGALDAEAGRDYLRADDVAPFAAACIELLDDRAARDRLTDAGHAVWRARYSDAAFTERLAEIVRDTVEDPPGR